MPTIRNSELTAEQWKKVQEDLKSGRLIINSPSDFQKQFETDILKEGQDYIYTKPREPENRTATDFTRDLTTVTNVVNAAGIDPSVFTKELKDGDARFGPDGIEFYHSGKWVKTLTDITNAAINSVTMNTTGIATITGRKAEFTICDDLMNEDQIVSDNTDVLASIKKANQLDIKAVPEEERRIDFHGGMVAMYLNDKGFRRKAAKSCNMTFIGFYDGKKKGVICKLMPTTPEDFINGGFPENMERIEVPVIELTSCFAERDVLKVLGAMTTYVEGEAPQSLSGLYSEESIAGLPDFGAF